VTPPAQSEGREGREWVSFECGHGHRFAMEVASNEGRVPKCAGCGTVTVEPVAALVVPKTEADRLREALEALAEANDWVIAAVAREGLAAAALASLPAAGQEAGG
jgi:hypothetical protein